MLGLVEPPQLCTCGSFSRDVTELFCAMLVRICVTGFSLGQRSTEGFPVRKLSALGYFPVLLIRWNTLMSEILTLNPLKK